MLLPLKKDPNDQLLAKQLASKLSKITLSNLLDHQVGIVVRESLKRSDANTHWNREYQIRFHFENLRKITATFGIVFDDLEKTVKSILLSRLVFLVNKELRRVGEKVLSKKDSLSMFQSNIRDVGDEGGGGGRRDTEEEGAEEGKEERMSDELIFIYIKKAKALKLIYLAVKERLQCR